MEDVAADAVHGQAVVAEEGFNVATEVLVDDLGDLRGEDDLEAGVGNVPAHDALGVAIEGRTRGDDAGGWLLDAGGALAEWGVGTGDDDRGRAVAEETAGDKVGDGLVVVLPGEGAELNGEKEGVLIGEGADVIGGTGDARGSGDTAKAEDGGALDVYGERHPVDEAGVDGGAGDAGDRGEEDGGDVGGGEAYAFEGCGNALLAEINGGFDPGVVGLGEGVQGGVGLEGEDNVAELDAAVGVEAVEETGLLHFVLPAVAEGLGDDCLWIAMERICRAD